MSGLIFEDLAPAVPSAPQRADVACFVGFVARRVKTRIVPPASEARSAAAYPLYAWLAAQGWARRPYQGPSLYGTAPPAQPPPWTRSDEELESLLDLPVPLESWEQFDRLFAWDERPIGTERGATYLGTAIRSFFAQGGHRCYVVRIGDPWDFNASENVRQRALRELLPGFPDMLHPRRADRASWRGIGHLFGLPDVSFLCLPDLPDAVSSDRDFPKSPPAPPAPAEIFVECSRELPPAFDPGRFVRGFPAPRCTRDGFADWAAALRATATLLQEPRNGLREIQLVAAIPLPARSPGQAPPESDVLGWLSRENPWLDGILNDGSSPRSFASAFVQLAWPWLKTRSGGALPEQLEGPDGALSGVLARNALTRGTYRSAAGLPLAQVLDVYPPLRGQDREVARQGLGLIDRVSLLGPTAGGMKVLSDVTTASGESYRQANVNRLVSAIVRAARRLGENFTFAPSQPRLWANIRGSLEALLTGLWRDGALRGRTASDAFSVRCDRTLMSERDVEEGRVLVEIRFEAAAAIEQIRVVLALSEGAAALVRAA